MKEIKLLIDNFVMDKFRHVLKHIHQYFGFFYVLMPASLFVCHNDGFMSFNAEVI